MSKLRKYDFDISELKRYCDNEQDVQIIEKIKESETPDGIYFTTASEQLDIHRTTVQRRFDKVLKKAEELGFKPHENISYPIPESQCVNGYSTFYVDGEKKAEWVKTSKRQEDILRAMRDASEAFIERVPAKAPSIEKPSLSKSNKDLLNCYILTDYHLGMLAWGEETKDENWDIERAEDILIEWLRETICLTPNSETAILANIGDWLHFDGLIPVTPTSGNVLDADTRYQKVVQTAINCIDTVIEMLLQKHTHVHMIMAEGNHDMASSAWLREMFSHFYRNEPRITVDRSPDPYYCYEFGDTSLFFQHGHNKKMSNVEDVFVSKFREIFGRTKYSYGHLGHLHHKVKESNLMVVEQHRTMAAKDAHASRGGYASGRSSDCITYHRDYGEVSRVTVSREMLEI